MSFSSEANLEYIAVEEYEKALKAGKKYVHQCLRKGEYPYTYVLDEILDESDSFDRQDVGLVDIPADFIVGTQSAGRMAAFAGNFMPLLPLHTEFSSKWEALCAAHMSDTGIRDPIKCLEYLGKFYVIEGNKRVSVLKHFGAQNIPGYVTRIIPEYNDDDQAVVVYYEFLKFYELTNVYNVDFNYPGQYKALLKLLGMPLDHKWTDDERKNFKNRFYTFSCAYKPLKEDHKDITDAEALLSWLRINEFNLINTYTQKELTQQITDIIPDVLASRHTSQSILSIKPEESRRIITPQLFSFGAVSPLKVAFIYQEGTEHGDWTIGHDNGRKYVEQVFGKAIDVSVYHAYKNTYYSEMDKAVKNGADIVFATTPAMIETARYLSTIYKNVKFLVCTLSMPYTGIRMYYTRTYECKFIAGVIAAIMSDSDTLSYTAHYPIYGTPANIDAFALGASMVNPKARIQLHWTCLENDTDEDGLRNASSNAHLKWNWGYFYDQIIRSVFDGTWDNLDKSKPINYWWGLDSGAADIEFSSSLPTGVRTLCENLKWNIINGTLDPFHMFIKDQDGNIRNDGNGRFTPEERLNIDWLCDNVIGHIPELSEIMDMSKDTVRILGIHRSEQLDLERKEAQL